MCATTSDHPRSLFALLFAALPRSVDEKSHSRHDAHFRTVHTLRRSPWTLTVLLGLKVWEFHAPFAVKTGESQLSIPPTWEVWKEYHARRVCTVGIPGLAEMLDFSKPISIRWLPHYPASLSTWYSTVHVAPQHGVRGTQCCGKSYLDHRRGCLARK